MDLTPSAEQEAFLTATSDWCRDAMPIEAARARPANLWQQLEAMGLTGISAPEAQGGMGLEFGTEALVFAELGRHLAPIALISTAVVRHSTDHAAKAGLTLAGAGAVRLLDARDAGIALGVRDGRVATFDVPAGLTWGVAIDQTVPLARVAPSPDGSDISAPRAALHLQLLAAAFALGAADLARDMAADYAKVREQFDRPIGWFQAIKHICADMAVRCAVARSQLYYAACALDAGTGDAAFHVAAAKRLADRAALDNGRANIQVHGGIGMTDEAYAHLPLKRAHLLGFIAPVSSSDLLTPELEPA
ncbi:acyl-CoA dehydrogenase [Sphingomonas lacunae]|uniref:Acyl-CoA dehydrogenase n=1 Tax=Sphingomonas lacunae TaxID=2698828 RepID=A0A6M4ATP0_9SPHN|nr:acyl-CoA dehydrogenase [Sphingomonas lacunae]QJQ31409.1 acyl-CoA dehydrogenase [Sphingomonas lacunae]